MKKMGSLRPNSVCDTTPLQRFESQSSSSEPSPSSLNGFGVVNKNSAINRSSHIDGDGDADGHGDDNGLISVKIITRNNDSLSNPSTATKTTTTTGTVADTETETETTATTLAASLNHNNNNKIEINFKSIEKPFGARKMSSERGVARILSRITCDLCILGCVLLPIFGMQYWGEPHERGFFCADESIRLPFQPSTVKNWHMLVMCCLVPMSAIILVEFYRSHDDDIRRSENLIHPKYCLCHITIPYWLVTCYNKIGFLIIGAGVSKLTTDIAKYSVGRLRPYFYTVCQPIMSDGTTCNHKKNAERYIEDFFCHSPEATPETLKSMRLSFPSGHTNLAFFTMVYTVIYLQKRMTWESSKMFRNLLQFLLLMFAWYTALTRVSDYKHHYTDVLAGAAIGTTYSVIVTLAMW